MYSTLILSFSMQMRRSSFTFSNSKPFDGTAILKFTELLLKTFVPHCDHIVPVLNARVPIVKLRYKALDLDCDLALYPGYCSLSSQPFLRDNTCRYCSNGVTMSKILWTYSELDWRAKALAFVVREWAKQAGLTSSTGQWQCVTNFQLILLVLFFLVSKEQAVLPPVSALLRPPIQFERRSMCCACTAVLGCVKVEHVAR